MHIKNTLIGIISLFISLAFSATNADWQCDIHNAYGQMWYGRGPTRVAAIGDAMHFCIHHSIYAHHCVIDYCRYDRSTDNFQETVIVRPSQNPQTWVCIVENNAAEQFQGSGMDQGSATANAFNICSARTLHARNCIVKSCLLR